MVVATSTALLTAAALGTAGAIYSGSQANKAAKSASQAQLDAIAASNEPSLEYQRMMLPLQKDFYENYYYPFQESVFPMEQRFQEEYAYPLKGVMAEAQMGEIPLASQFQKDYFYPYQREVAGAQLGLLPGQERAAQIAIDAYGNIIPKQTRFTTEELIPYETDLMGARREQLPSLLELLERPTKISDEESARIWGRTRQRIAAPFEAERQRAGERFASKNMMRSGAYDEALMTIGTRQAETETKAAIDQAIYETNLERSESDKRLAEKMIFASPTYKPSVPMPSAMPGVSQMNIGAVGTSSPISFGSPGFNTGQMSIPQGYVPPGEDYGQIGSTLGKVLSQWPTAQPSFQAGMTWPGGGITTGQTMSQGGMTYPVTTYGAGNVPVGMPQPIADLQFSAY